MNIPFRLYGFKPLILAIFLILVIGCAGVKIEVVSPKDQITKQNADILTTGKLSSASQEVLRIIGKEIKACEKDALNCQAILRTAKGISEEQRLSAMAELWLKIALEGDKKHPKKVEDNLQSWLETTRFAYGYLFFSERKPNARAFEDRQIQVRNYYNYALQQSIANIYALYSKHNKEARSTIDFRLGKWLIHTDLGDSGLTNNALPVELINAKSINFSGIRNIYQRDGFGADLIAVLPNDAAITVKNAKEKPFIQQTYVPITALLKFKGKTLKEVLATNALSLTLFSPYKTEAVTLGGEKAPLSANFTANYGLWLAHSGFAKQAMMNLFGRAGGITKAQLYLMQPYDPNKKIAIMLHGLASSPEAWINLANEVLGDKKLRNSYQIWIIYYPTNAPIAMNHHDIREVINQTLKTLDPMGANSASTNITLIGHSMGGILSRLMLSESKDQLLNALEDYDRLSPAKKKNLKEKLNPYLVFSPLPEAKSGIFIATPHQGTSIANHKLARWVANLVHIPANMLKRVVGTALGDESLPDIIKIPNSIDNLSDQDPFVKIASTLPISPDVTYYSIIGNNTPKRTLLDSSDGIVPYKSAHLDEACSEKIILSAHSVQETPEAILEIRRILMNQLNTKFKSCP